MVCAFLHHPFAYLECAAIFKKWLVTGKYSQYMETICHFSKFLLLTRYLFRRLCLHYPLLYHLRPVRSPSPTSLYKGTISQCPLGVESLIVMKANNYPLQATRGGNKQSIPPGRLHQPFSSLIVLRCKWTKALPPPPQGTHWFRNCPTSQMNGKPFWEDLNSILIPFCIVIVSLSHHRALSL